MNIYVAHSGNYDYLKLLYYPIRNSDLNIKYNIVLPHENKGEPYNSKEYLKKCDLMIADVSLPSTGEGIELGWADIYKTPIVCVFLKNTKISNSLKVLTDDFIEYENPDDLVLKLINFLNEFSKRSSN